MTKEKIKDLFKLDELVSILKVMDNYKDVVSIKLKEVAINDNTYDILKNGDTVIIKDHNNSTGIGLSYKYYESDNFESLLHRDLHTVCCTSPEKLIYRSCKRRRSAGYSPSS